MSNDDPPPSSILHTSIKATVYIAVCMLCTNCRYLYLLYMFMHASE